MTLSHWDTDSRPCWHLRIVVDAGVATRLLAAAGAQPRFEPTREGGISVRTGNLDSPAFADCNTARMTVGDIGHFLFRFFKDEHREHALVSDGIARPILELLGYVPANPAWRRSEESRDHHLSWLYCRGERTAVRHPTGRMYTRGGSLPDVYSAYTTRAQLNCLAAQASVWATGFFANGSPPAPTSNLLGHPSADPTPAVPPIAAPDPRPIADRRPARRPADPGLFRYAPPDDHPDEPVVQPGRQRASGQPVP